MVARAPGARPPRSRWVPTRQEVIWIDCNPQVGREMRDIHPFLVLSPQAFNDRTSLVIGLPMSSAPHNADHPFAILAGTATGRKAGVPSYVLCHQPKSFDWRVRGGKAHPMGMLPDPVFRQVCEGLNQIIQLSA